MGSSGWIHVPNNALGLICQFYNRTEASLLEDVTTLKDWMKTQHHLPEILDDKVIQNFLILNKCSVEKTKQKIDRYYSIRNIFPEVYATLSCKSGRMKQLENVVTWVVLPNLTKELYRVLIFKVLDSKMANQLDVLHLVCRAAALQEVRLKEDVMFGEVFFFDMDGLNLGTLSKFTPTVLARSFAVYSKVLSLPMKKCYVINSPSFLGTFVATLKSAVKPKIFNRIQLCEDSSIMETVLDRKDIPSDYGGDGKSIRELNELSTVKINEYEGRFQELYNMRVNENLRPEKLGNDEILGFYGNFKKLDID